MSHTYWSKGLAGARAARADQQRHRAAAYAVQATKRGTSPDVRAKSFQAGPHEERLWRQHNRFSAAVRAQRVREVKRWSLGLKQPGRRSGALSARTIDAYDYLMGIRDFRTGACFPSIRGIAAAIRCAVSTAEKAIRELCEHGLLGRRLRTRPVDNPVPGGPVVEQITTAYWFLVPAWLADKLAQAFGSAPKPDDQLQRERDDAERVMEMLAAGSLDDVVRFRAGDASPMAEALRSLGRRVEASEAIPPDGMYPGLHTSDHGEAACGGRLSLPSPSLRPHRPCPRMSLSRQTTGAHAPDAPYEGAGIFGSPRPARSGLAPSGAIRSAHAWNSARRSGRWVARLYAPSTFTFTPSSRAARPPPACPSARSISPRDATPRSLQMVERLARQPCGTCRPA